MTGAAPAANVRISSARDRRPGPNAVQAKNVAKGAVKQKRPGIRTVFVELDEETIEVLRARAIKEGTGLGEQLRTMIDWGMENLE